MDKYLTKTLGFVLVSCDLRKQMLDYIRVRILSEKACTCNLPEGIAELTSDCTPHEFLLSKRQNECRHICCQNACQNMHMKFTTSNVRLYFKLDVSIFRNCSCQSTNQTRCHMKFAPSHFRIYTIYMYICHMKCARSNVGIYETCQITCQTICQSCWQS